MKTPSRKLLFIEPQQPASLTPVIDHLTRKLCAAFRKSRVSDYAYGGIHICSCQACSSSSDYFLPNGIMTNSLCVHYVAYHRSEVPPEQLAIIEAFTFGELEPVDRELRGGRFIKPQPPESEAYSDQDYPKEILKSLKALDAQIELLNQRKEGAIVDLDFDKAVRIRDQANALKKLRSTLLRSSRLDRTPTVDECSGTNVEMPND